MSPSPETHRQPARHKAVWEEASRYHPWPQHQLGHTGGGLRKRKHKVVYRCAVCHKTRTVWEPAITPEKPAPWSHPKRERGGFW